MLSIIEIACVKRLSCINFQRKKDFGNLLNNQFKDLEEQLLNLRDELDTVVESLTAKYDKILHNICLFSEDKVKSTGFCRFAIEYLIFVTDIIVFLGKNEISKYIKG